MAIVEHDRHIESKETEAEPVIRIQSGTVLVELTRRCRTGCGHCYLCNEVGPDKPLVEADVLKKRFDWINEFTDARGITLLGGEPLLHPDFIELAEYVKSLGMRVGVVTSAKISGRSEVEQANLEYVVEGFCDGEVNLDLSLQPERNELAFLHCVEMIQAGMQKRRGVLERERDNLAKAKLYAETTGDTAAWEYYYALEDEGKERRGRKGWTTYYGDVEYDLKRLGKRRLDTTVTVDPQMSFEHFCRIWEFVYVAHGDDQFWDKPRWYEGQRMSSLEMVEIFWEQLQNHSKSFMESRGWAIAFELSSDFVHKFRVWGAVRFEDVDGFKKPHLSKGFALPTGPTSVCGLMGAKVEDGFVEIGTPTVRVDGTMFMSQPQCIHGDRYLVNLDTDLDKGLVRDQVAAQVEWVQAVNVKSRRDLARWKRDPKENCRALGRQGSSKYLAMHEGYPTDLHNEPEACWGCHHGLACPQCMNPESEMDEVVEWYRGRREQLGLKGGCR